MGPAIHQAMADAYEAAQGTDALIITGPSYYFGVSVATKLKVPFIQAYAQPLHPTGAFSSALFPLKNMSNPIFNYASHIIGGQMFWQLMRPILNAARRDFLQLPPIARIGDFIELTRRKLPVLYGYSQAVLPKPRNWGDFLHVTGYWFLDQPGWQPPADLQAFLDAGSPPVYIGFGSMSDRNPERMTEIVLKALAMSKQRGILMTGWGGLSQADLPDHVFKLEAAPHDWLFPRMAAVVHHGGAGTTAAGLRSGKPSILIPFFGDQTFWGVRVAALGVGAMLERKQLTSEMLAASMHAAVTNGEMQLKAAALGECIRAEDGIGAAAQVIEQSLERV
jgi:sterol 3beta-glucosyltransferase